MNIFERLLAIIAPHECLGCKNEGSLLCYQCQLQLPTIVKKCYRCGRTDAANRVCSSCRGSSDLHSLAAVTPYEKTAKALVRGLKYERKQAGAAAIASAMALHLDMTEFKECVLACAPTAPQRARTRGYDQAELIAKALAKQSGLLYSPLLVRMGKQRQVGQTRAVRKQQMVHAFRVINNNLLQNKHVVLIDDVITTGATLESAAHVLRSAGAKRVSAVVFAAA